ncbi:non-ribosomal peptide synthase/polyketide synthase [Ruminiclostridium papyrosolvens]|uniref:Carrier domain-containing protein n=1 Tax=Ruminiclostridium papyrosolvens C7 TaxID=1330534 RepID=U4QWU5_9FIRM|nr:non-ribosomal peptide synthetase [Ruminiclostridium papyrosolvens]EPR07806.1 hypothetical protein L323_20255 [Ruminiclostridium papyrosolvens C7]
MSKEINNKVEGIYLLTSMQEGMLFYKNLNEKDTSYFIQSVLNLKGVIDIKNIQEAIDLLAVKHDALRTAFLYKKVVKPRQVVMTERKLENQYIDLSNVQDRNTELERIKKEDVDRGFDLSRDPLMRAILVKISNDEYKMIWSFHHIIMDGWCFSLILKDFMSNYERLQKGSSREELVKVIKECNAGRTSYGEYLKWLEKQDRNEGLKFWKEVLEDYGSTADIIPQTAGIATEEQVKTAELRIEKELCSAIKEISKKNKVTVNTYLEVAWGVLLQKYNRTNDVVFGKVVSGRNADLKGINETVGLFINSIPARIKADDNISVKELVDGTMEQSVESSNYVYNSLADIQEITGLGKDLIKTLFVFENYYVDKEAYEKGIEDLSMQMESAREQTNYAISFKASFSDQGFMLAGEDSLDLSIMYDPKRYTSQEIEQLLRRYEIILAQILYKQDIRISDIELISEEEIDRIKYVFNNTHKDYPQNLCLHELFEKQVEENPDSVAASFKGTEITYKQLNSKANQIARKLKELGVMPKDTVVIMAERSIELLIALYAVMKAGGTYIPVDPTYPQERLEYIVSDCKPKAILTRQDCPGFNTEVPFISLIDDNNYTCEEANLPIVNSPEDPVYIIYTSGTTGKPKGVVVRHKSVVNHLYIVRDRFYKGDVGVTPLFTNPSFDLTVPSIFGPISFGSKCFIYENIDEGIADIFKNDEIALVKLTPSLLKTICMDKNLKKPKNLKCIVLGGEKLDKALLNKAYDLLGGEVEIHNEYGPTEATVFATSTLMEKDSEKIVTIGNPVENMHIYILDGIRLCGIGIVGELCISGIGLATGYLNKAELTAEKFIDNPFEEGKLYRSGDLARWLPDGTIEFIDRIDDQVKIRGFRIETAEIENVLHSIEGINDAVVIPRKDENGENELYAYLVSDIAMRYDQVREKMRRILPDYMIPNYMMTIDEIPLTLNGKLDKRKLPVIDVKSSTEYLAPRNEIEKNICSIFEEVLNKEKIGVRDNFFEIGGHSLRATRVINQIEINTGIRLPLQLIFGKPTAEEIAEELATRIEGQHTSIPKAETKKYYPMSSTQKRMYFMYQIDESGISYNMPNIMRVRGSLNVERLKDAFSFLLCRHEILRTEFHMQDGNMVQEIHENPVVDFTYIESQLSVDELAESFVRRFELEKLPLIRMQVAKTNDEMYILLDMHHIVSDGVSEGVFINELLKRYNGMELEELRIQYKDYSEWMNIRDFSKQKEFWIKTFEGEIPVIDLPYDFTRPQNRSYKGKMVKTSFGKEIKDQILKVSKSTGSTEYMILLSAVMILLGKYSRQEDIVVGSPISGRTHKDIENMMGMFINTLAMRARPRKDETVLGFINTVKEMTLQAYENQEYPFEQLVEDLNIQSEISRNALFDVMFVYQNYEKRNLKSKELTLEACAPEIDIEKFDLTIHVDVADDEYLVAFNYCLDLFCEESIRIMMKHLEVILCSMMADTNQKIKDVGILTVDEKDQVIYQFNNTFESYPLERTVIEMFEEQVKRCPDNIALEYGDIRLTYGDLNARANCIASKLRNLGVKSDDRVAIIAERSIETVLGIVAVLKAGGAYVPVDPGYPVDRIQFMLEDCSPKAILVGKTEQSVKVCIMTLDIETVDLKNLENYSGKQDNIPLICSEDSLVYIIYTSGTTGKPKGVMIEHRSLMNYITYARNSYVKSEICMPFFTNPSFDLTQTSIFLPLCFGGKLVVYNDTVDNDINNIFRNQELTSVKLTPLHLKEAAALQDVGRLPNLNSLILGGEELDSHTSGLIVGKYGEHIDIHNEYGPTETTIGCCDYVYHKKVKTRTVSIGKPIANTQIFIMNDAEPCGIGVPGELCIAGIGVARGYLNRPELNAEKFIDNPFGEGKMYRSGDLARWTSDGNLEYMGRIDEQVKIRGFRVEPGEIENVIKKFEDIKEAVVIAREKDGVKYLLAYVVSDKTIDIGKIKNLLNSELPNYMVPARIMQIESLPMNKNGKLDKKSLPEIELAGSDEYEAPRNETEEKICGIFMEILGVQKVGIHDGFFDLGGHSLSATKLVNRIGAELGVKVPLKTIFRAGSPGEITKELDKLRENVYSAIPKAKDMEYYPMSSAQRRLYLINQIGDVSTVYNISGSFSLYGEFDEMKIKHAVEKITERHEILRTSFHIINGEMVQKISQNNKIDFSVIENATTELSKLRDDFRKPFDLQEAPLMRLCAVKRETETVLLVDIHHIISDGMSMDILKDELLKLYAGEELNEIRVHYKDYSQWMNHRDLSRQKEYWVSRFSDEVPVLNLPLDYKRPSIQSFKGGGVSTFIGPDRTAAIKNLARRTGTTEYMVLLSAVFILLGKYSRQDDIAVGSPVSGRTHKDTESMLGMFVNTLVMRAKPETTKQYIDFLSEVREICLSAYENQEFPFEELLEEIKVNRDISRNPLFDVMFSVQNNRNFDDEFEGININETAEVLNHNIAKFDLAISAGESNGGYLVLFEYCSDLFRKESILAMAGHFKKIIDEITDSNDLTLAEINTVTNEEKNIILNAFNNTSKQYAKEKTVVELFEEQVRNSPDRMAITYEDTKITYSELNSRVNCVAARLREMGIRPDDFVAVMAERSIEMIVGMLAVIKAGGAYVPIDASYPAERIDYILEDSGAKAVLIYNADVKTDIPVIDLANQQLWEGAQDNLPLVNKPNDLMYLIYTSGTSGKPKGVMLEHRGVVSMTSYLADLYQMSGDDVVLQFANCIFDASVWELTISLFTGASLCLIPQEVIADVKLFEEYVEEHRVTVTLLPPQFCLQTSVKGLRVLTTGGSAANREVIRKYGEKTRFINAYGPTENTVLATHWEYAPNTEIPNNVPIGKPIYNSRIYILDGNNLCGTGIPGELCITGDGLARGYLNLSDLTNEKFIDNLFGEGKMYRSGDLARWLPDGNIEYLGRIDEQVKIRGFRIELEEIENVIRKIPYINDSVAIAKPDNSGDNAIYAYVVSDEEVDLGTLKDEIRKSLPEYMIPGYMMQIDSIPVTGSGKVDKRALPDIEIRSSGEYHAPQNETETIICAAFCDVLNLEQTGIHDDFFELGGHSLRATKLVNKIEADTGVRLSLKDIFSSPTPELIASLVDAHSGKVYNGITPAVQKEYYAVSSAQKRMYLLNELDNTGVAYNISGILELSGKLDSVKFRRAVEQLTHRHEALRTSFTVVNGETVQVINDNVNIDITFAEAEEADIMKLYRGFVKPFDLSKAPLMQLMVVYSKNGITNILIDMHHIISDGMSLNIIQNDLIRLYNGEELPTLDLQYKDYSEWMLSRDLTTQQEYWKNQFSDDIPVLEMPLDYPRPSKQRFNGSSVKSFIGGALKERLCQLAQKSGTTEYMVLFSALMIILSKYSRQHDIIVGSPVSGRNHKDTEGIAGMFVNTLPLRAKPEGGKKFLDFLGEIKETCLKAYENQDFPFEEIVEAAGVSRDLSRNPLFDVMFVMENNDQNTENFEGLVFNDSAQDDRHTTSKFDLTFTLLPYKEGYQLLLEYSTDLYREDSVLGIMNHYIQVLDSITANYYGTVGDIEILTEGDRVSIAMFNRTETGYPKDKTLVELFEEQVNKAPDSIAVVFDDTNITYYELNKRSNILANKLRSMGVQPDDRIAVLAERSAEMIIGICAILKAGGAYVPIDTRYPETRIRYIIEDCSAKAVLVHKNFIDAGVPVIDLAEKSTWEGSSDNLPTVNKPSNLAYIIYTSGTTGNPKGSMIEHRSVIRLVKDTNYITFGADSVILQTGAMAFDASTMEVWGPLLNGGKLVLADYDVILEANALENVILKNKVNTMWLTSTLFNQLVEMKCSIFDSLDTLLIGGEKLSDKHVRIFKKENVKTRLINGYGPTENTTFTTTFCIPDDFERIPIGTPIANTRVYIVDERKALCGIGIPGEICAAGAGVSRGYLNKPELTEEKFIPGALGEDMLYCTGDLGRWLPDGNIEYLGRIDEQIKIRGFRIELSEIEAVIKGLDEVSDCAVMVHEDEAAQKAIYAYIVPKNTISTTDVKEQLRKLLPDYMIPSFIAILDKLPVTANGKLDKRALQNIKASSLREQVAPGTQTEKAIYSIFSSVLQTDELSIKDDFFEMGGHSLRAMRVINEIEEAMGIRLSLKDIFEYPTIERLSQFAEKSINGGFEPIPAVEQNKYYPMSSAQKRMYMIYHMDETGLSYNMPFIMKVSGGQLDYGRLERAFSELLRRHEILRTVFKMIDGNLIQKIQDKPLVECTYEENNDSLENIINGFVRKFKLEELPLIRLKVVRTKSDEYVMLDMHHIISDGMSSVILFDELMKLYGKQELMPLRVQYKDYSQWINSRDFRNQRQYWKDQFKGDIPVLDFPLDFTRPQLQTFRGKTIETTITDETRNKIIKLTKDTGTTEYMVLLAAFTMLLGKYTRQEDIIVGSPISGRTHKDTESMLGMFVNTLAFRTFPEKEKSFGEFLKEVKSTVMNGYDNQEYPFEELLEDLNIERTISRNPLFDVMFVYQNNERISLTTEEFSLEPCASGNDIEKFDMTVIISPAEKGYTVSASYCTDLFREESIDLLLVHFKNAIENAIGNTSLKLREISALDNDEYTKVTHRFNDNKTDYPSHKTIGELFVEQARQLPDAVALMSDSTAITYAELDILSGKIAAALRNEGVRAGDFVAVTTERTLETIIGILGIVKAGGAYVPIDLNYPEERLRYILEDCKPKVCLQGKEKLPLDTGYIIFDITDIGDYPAETPENINGPEDLAYLIYTSGTTGTPKGVMVKHRNVVRLVKNTNYVSLDRNTVIMQTGSLAFDASTFEIWGALLNGGKLVIASNEVLTNEKYLYKEIINKSVNTMWLTASLYNQMITGNSNMFDSILYLLIGGEKLSEKHVNMLKTVNNTTHLINGYGPTENTTFTTTYEIKECMNQIPIGRPIANTQVYIMNGHEVCGIGMPGELCTSGDGLSDGYLNNPQLTTEKFEPNIFGEGNMYHTGDLVRWLPDGNIEYLGRIDQQVKIRGFRIELGEIEATIRKSDTVKDVAVVLKEKPDDEKYICAYVVMRDGNNASGLKKELRKTLPEYMIPSRVIQLNELPLTINGKLDRKRLPEVDFTEDTEYIAPRNELENTVAGIFADILNIEKVGVTDNFFELGGHSLRATRLINRIEETAGARISLKEIFVYPTVEMLCSFIAENKNNNKYEHIPKAEIKTYYDMSSVQRRIYLLNQMEPDGIAYNMPRFMKIEGTLDAEKMKQAFINMIERHEILRTSFMMLDGRMVQKIEPSANVDFEYSSLSNSELEKTMKDFVRPFDLGKAPLFRVRLIENSGCWYMLVDIHHIISDGMSSSMFWKEVMQYYIGKNPGELNQQYRDYSEWMLSKDMKPQEDYWVSKFQNHVPELDLRLDYPRSRVQGFSGDTVEYAIGRELKQKIDQFCKTENVTPYMVFMSAAMVLLSIHSGKEEILLGTAMSGRTHKDVEEMLGMFVNTVVIDGKPAPDKQCLEFINEVRTAALKAAENQEYPFNELLDKLEIKRDISRNPLFDVMFVMQNNEKYMFDAGDIRITDISAEFKVEKFDITIAVGEQDSEYIVNLGYRNDLFKESSMNVMLSHLNTIISNMVQDPYQSIKDIQRISRDEEHKVLNIFNNTDAEYPRDKTVSEILNEQADENPDEIAVICGNDEISYAELVRKSDILAVKLRAMGVGQDDTVAVLAQTSIEMIIGICAILKAGGAYVPIDIRYPEARAQFIIKDCNPKAVLTCNSRIDTDVPFIDLADARIFEGACSKIEVINRPTDLAYIIYTSGTTGNPKGTMIEHRSILRLVKNNNFLELNRDTVIMQTGAMAFDASTLEVWGSLLNGGRLVLAEQEVILNASLLGAAIEKYHVNTMWLTSTLFNQLVETDCGIFDPLKYLLIGGEKLSDKHVRMFKENNISTRLINGYGPTENTTFTTTYSIPDKFERMSIGSPVSNSKVYILDKNNYLCGINVPGELCTTGDGVARGYLNREQLTGEKFTDNPFGEGRMYRTGDLARWLPDGNIEFLGRIDEQVKIRGFRVELGEIETVIKGIDGIKDCAVIVREDDKGDKRICAFIVGDGTGREVDVRASLRNLFPDYMIPSYIAKVDFLPVTRNGKLDVRALPDIIMEETDTYAAPENDTQNIIAGIFEDVLGIKKVGIKDDFFELGGHSLKATKVINRLEAETGCRVSLKDIFTYSTVEKLSEIVDKSNNNFTEIPVYEVKPYYLMSSAQKRIFIVSQFDETRTAYNMPMVYVVKGELDIEKLKSAFGRLVCRHEILHTRFYMKQNEAVQEIIDSCRVDFEYEESNSFNVDEAVRKFVRPFDFMEGCLLRVKVVKYCDSYYLFIDTHHIISDGMSVSIMFKELSKLYMGKELPELRIQYTDYCQWMTARGIEKQKEYWLQEFSDEIPVLELPLDFKREKTQSFNGKIINSSIDECIRENVKKLSKSTGATEYMVLLSAIMITLGRFSNQEDIVVGSPIFGRTHKDVENLIGVFVNTLALRGKPEGHKKYIDFLNEIKEKSLRAYQNQDYQFDDLVEALDIKRDFSRNPLFDVMFSFQNNDNAILEMDNITMEPVEHCMESQKFDLTIYIGESENSGYDMSIGYCTDLFKEDTIRNISSHFMLILKNTLENPEQKIMDIEILSPEEKDRLLNQFNNTGTTYPSNFTICHLFEKQAYSAPDAIAAVYKGVRQSYSELNSAANRIANHLKRHNVGKEDIVGIMLEPSEFILSGLLGILKSGAAYLPVDPDYPEERIEYMLEDSKAEILLTQQSLAGKVKFSGKTICIDNDFSYESAEFESDNKPSDLAYVIYTSGSTGKPKGVMVEHRCITNLVYWHNRVYSITEKDIATKYAGFGFDASVWEIYPYLAVGAQIHIIEKDLRMNMAGLNKYFEENGVTVSFLPTQICEQFIKQDNRSLRVLLTGGDKLRSFISRGYSLVNNYGPTENTVVSTYFTVDREYDNIPIGKPVDNVRAYVIDKNYKLVPEGMPGQLAVAGDSLARGYLFNESLTKEKFIENAFSYDSRIYLTGDIVRWTKDGNLEYLGRCDEQVKIRGNRVEIGEIEKVALQFQGITDCVATVWETKSADKRIALYYCASETIDAQELKAFIARFLPGYMIPNAYCLLDNMPVTSNGKVDKKKLPDPEAFEEKVEITVEMTEIMENVLDVWKEVLETENIGVYDNFFDVGGNSILLISMHEKLEEIYPKALSISDIFANPSIVMLAEVIEKHQNRNGEYRRLKGIVLPEVFFSGDIENGGTGRYNYSCTQEQVNGILRQEADYTELQNIFTGIYYYLLNNISKQEKIQIQCRNSDSKYYSLDIDLEDNHLLDSIVNKVKEAREHAVKNSYDLNEISRAFIENLDGAQVVPLLKFGNKSSKEEAVLFDYEICIKIMQDTISFDLIQFNERLNGQYMEHMLNSYINLILKLFGL